MSGRRPVPPPPPAAARGSRRSLRPEGKRLERLEQVLMPGWGLLPAGHTGQFSLLLPTPPMRPSGHCPHRTAGEQYSDDRRFVMAAAQIRSRGSRIRSQASLTSEHTPFALLVAHKIQLCSAQASAGRGGAWHPRAPAICGAWGDNQSVRLRRLGRPDYWRTQLKPTAFATGLCVSGRAGFRFCVVC